MAANPQNPRGAYRKQSLAERIAALSIPEPNSGCMLWLGATTKAGYGRIAVEVYGEPKKTRLAHVVAFELQHGHVPAGLELDHRCDNTSCVNPAHLRPMTHRDNVLRSSSPAALRARQTHCKAGHPLSGENVYVDPSGRRKCRTCVSNYRSEYRARTGS